MRSTNTQQSQVHLSTELGPPGGLEPQEPKIRQLAGSKWRSAVWIFRDVSCCLSMNGVGSLTSDRKALD